MPMPKITIGLDAASRAKYKSSLAAQLSFFSITQTDDPIPRTNFSFSVYYVLGALAALLYALLDPSCVEVTAYRTDMPIDDCTSMLASFACRTADFDLATGAGFTRTYNSLTCLGGKNTSEGVLGAHPPSKCPDIQEASFKCKTADYDQAAGTGFERTFSPAGLSLAGGHRGDSRVQRLVPAVYVYVDPGGNIRLPHRGLRRHDHARDWIQGDIQCRHVPHHWIGHGHRRRAQLVFPSRRAAPSPRPT